MRYFYSDPHFGHYNVIKYSNRPFKHVVEGTSILFEGQVIAENVDPKIITQEAERLSVELMTETFISNWNAVVKPEDEVWVVGDFAMKIDAKAQAAILKRLNGKKYLILGNHDRKAQAMKDLGFTDCFYEYELTLKNGKTLLLSHYPYVPLELNDMAESRPNIIKFMKNIKTNPDFDVPYEMGLEKLKKIGKIIPYNPELDPDKKQLNQMKRVISAHIGSRLVNKGKILGHGHTHSTEKRFANMINFSVEAWNYTPVAEDTVIELMEEIEKEMQGEFLTLQTHQESKYDYYTDLYLKLFAYKLREKFPGLQAIQELSNLYSTYEHKCSTPNSDIACNIPTGYSKKWYEEAVRLNMFIPQSRLVAGEFYEGDCRNASWAYYTGEKFIYWRSKFGSEYLEEIETIENDKGFDVFSPHKVYDISTGEKTKFLEALAKFKN